jgi:hypothetical protein
MFAKIIRQKKQLCCPETTNLVSVYTKNDRYIGPGFYYSFIFKIGTKQFIIRHSKTFDVSTHGCFIFNKDIKEYTKDCYTSQINVIAKY